MHFKLYGRALNIEYAFLGQPEGDKWLGCIPRAGATPYLPTHPK